MSGQEQRNKEIIRRAIDALNDRDRTAFAELVADDAIHRTPWGTTRGEAYVDNEIDTVEKFSDHVYEIEELVAEDDLVAVQFAVTATPPPEYLGFETNRDTYDIDTMELFRIEDGQIVETFALADRLEIYEEFGILNDWRIRNQYLSVLTRVLRHNLRNDLGSIINYAEAIVADETDAGEHAAAIRSAAQQLVDLAEKARALEDLAVERPLIARNFQVARKLREWSDDLRESYPAATITVLNTTEEPVVRTDPWLVETIVTELVENAIIHTDREHPHVELSAVESPSDGGIAVRVTDNGPGIPPHEIEPLEQESEDPLIHGSSVGLWAVKWSVERLNGTLDFGENDNRGSIVTVRLPNLDDSG